jgi:hypothetical protein
MMPASFVLTSDLRVRVPLPSSPPAPASGATSNEVPACSAIIIQAARNISPRAWEPRQTSLRLTGRHFGSGDEKDGGCGGDGGTKGREVERRVEARCVRVGRRAVVSGSPGEVCSIFLSCWSGRHEHGWRIGWASDVISHCQVVTPGTNDMASTWHPRKRNVTQQQSLFLDLFPPHIAPSSHGTGISRNDGFPSS